MFKSGTIAHSIWRGFMALVAYGIPLILFQMPVEIQSMTLGTMLMILAHYAEKNMTA